MDERLQHLLDDTTAGLRDDPELRLEVKSELLDHLEATTQNSLNAGCSEEESVTAAITQFGSATETYQELLEVNQHRMKFRAVLRLFMRKLLVPAAVLVAFIIGYGGLVQLQQIPKDFIPILESLPMKTSPFMDLIIKTGIYHLPYFNQKSTSTKVISSSNIIQNNFKDQALFAYTNCVILGHPLEENLRYGESIDPENAIYNYRLALQQLRQASWFEYNDNAATQKKHPLILHIRNRQLLNQAMNEVRIGLCKPYIRLYIRDILAQQLNKLPPPGDITDAYHSSLLAAKSSFPLLSLYRYLTQIIPLYAKVLIREGRTKEAQPFIDGWKQWATQEMQYPDTMLTLFGTDVIVQEWGEQSAQCYEMMGQQQAAIHTREEIQRFTKPINTWKQQQTLAIDTFQQHGNVILTYISRLDIVLFGRAITDNAHLLTPQRVIGYALFETIFVKLMLIILCILLLGLVMIQVSSRIFRGKNISAPLLLLFHWQDVARFAGYAILLPLVSYVLYTNLPISARNLNIEVNQLRFALEMLLLLVMLLLLPGWLAVRIIRKRCFSLSIPIPPKKRKREQRQVGDYRMYHGTVISTLIPVYALTIILITALSQPYLQAKWFRAYQQDQLFFVHPGESMPALEAKTMTQLRAEMLAVTKDWDKPSSDSTNEK